MYSVLVTKKILQASAFREFGFFKVLPIRNPRRPNAVFLTNRSSTIVCIRVQWNHSDLSGVPPRVGCWLGGY